MTSDQTIRVAIKVIILCFLDVVCRYSYQYLGWLSYIVDHLIVVGFMSRFQILPMDKLKLVFRFITGTSLTILAWHLMSMFEKFEKTQSDFPAAAFIIYVHIEFLIGLSILYAWKINTLLRFIVQTYFFFVAGTTLQIAPGWTYNLFIMATIFVLVITTLHVFEHGSGLSHENFDFLEEHDLRSPRYFERIRLILRKSGPEYQIYFIFMTILTFNYYWTFFDLRGYKWVFLSTIGACCSNVVAVQAFYVTFMSLSSLILKIYSVVIKGWNALEQQYGLSPDYSITVVLITADMFFYDMQPFERGNFVVNRLWLLFALLVETCLSLLQSISAEQETIQSRLCASIRMVILYLSFIMFSTYPAYGLYLLYPMTDLAIFLTTSCFVTITVRTVTSFLIFLLYKFDSVSTQFWEHFDDIVFYTRIALGAVILCIHVSTACFGVWTLCFGSFTKLDIFRLFSLCYLNIYKQFIIWRNVLNHRKEITQLTANLTDACKDEISNYNDVCSICYQDMGQAKVTPCYHLFHEICLRKWLGSKTKKVCPLCNTKIVPSGS